MIIGIYDFSRKIQNQRKSKFSHGMGTISGHIGNFYSFGRGVVGRYGWKSMKPSVIVVAVEKR